jgi:hypothetical protein
MVDDPSSVQLGWGPAPPADKEQCEKYLQPRLAALVAASPLIATGHDIGLAIAPSSGSGELQMASLVAVRRGQIGKTEIPLEIYQQIGGLVDEALLVMR